ncbi:MAG: hypothetical protein LUE27_10510 [Clostridia bacterium]|nr:hypothetical protein [Clostridia bacterium]
MTNLTDALNFIDGDLIADAAETIDARKESHLLAKNVRWGIAPNERGHSRAMIITICCSIVVLCAAIVLWCLLAFTGVSATDPTRIGDNIISDTFETFYDIYPDAEMAERLNELGLENTSYELYYNKGTDWTDGGNWFSFFITSQSSEAVRDDGTCRKIYLDVMFTGTVDDWLGNITFTNGLRTVTIGDTEVTYTTNEDSDTTENESGYSFAYFEKNNILYELTVSYGNNTLSKVMSILEMLLE